MQAYPRTTTSVEIVVALSALIAIVPGAGAVPVVHGLVPSEVAVLPGVIVIEQLLPADNIGPQVVEYVVPLGKLGEVTSRFSAGWLPVLVTVMILATPELGVPLIPYSVSPVTLRANVLTLLVRVVVLVVHTTPMFEIFAVATVPVLLLTVHVWFAG